MKHSISIILIAIAVILGYFGFQKLENSRGSVAIGDIELTAEDSSSKTQAYIMLGGAALCLILGGSRLSRHTRE